MSPSGKAVAIIQARMTSSRLPGKSMLDLAGKPLVQRVIERVSRAESLDEVWLATSDTRFDDIIAWTAADCGAKVFRGGLEDVLGRYAGAAREAGAQVVVRITADNPLSDPRFIDRGVGLIREKGLDYLRFDDHPYWVGAEVFQAEALFRAEREAKAPEEREHVTPYLQDPERFKTLIADHPWDDLRRPDIRLTLDTMEDYYTFVRIYRHFRHMADIPVEEVIAFLDGGRR